MRQLSVAPAWPSATSEAQRPVHPRRPADEEEDEEEEQQRLEDCLDFAAAGRTEQKGGGAV